MRTCKTLICTLLLLLAGTLLTGAQEVRKARFNPDFSFRDFRIEYGRLFQLDGDIWDAHLIQGHYTEQFWQHMAYRLGGQLAIGTHGYACQLGAPAAFVYKPGTIPLSESMRYAFGMSAYEVARSGYYSGFLFGMGAMLLQDLFMALFRRTEYFIGLTPGFYFGPRYGEEEAGGVFSLTADVGAVFSIPIWRFCLNLSPTYHFALTRNVYYADGRPSRNFASITGGITYLF